ncbi:MAG: stage II sporulation protein P [Oscillospiraceae bacterium]|nr:stage II sporulation protein P [Oscillospiraceae bacterium]
MKKTVICAALVAMAVKLAAAAGVGSAVGTWLSNAAEDGSLVSATLRLELGTDAGDSSAAVSVPTPQPTEAAYTETLLLVQATPSAEITQEETETPEDEETEILPAAISSTATIKNDTSIDVDIEALSAEGLSLTLQAGEPQILIVHTHGSEAYTMDGDDVYEESDESRTQDKSHNVIRVGDELAEKLRECGLNVIHDREIYDYPSYTGSYSRSAEAVESYLEKYPSIAIVIDLHRDAIGSGDVIYKTVAEADGESCAQVMLVVGTGENGLYHPNWRENLKLALYMQNAMDARYKTLARPIELEPERYNQQLTTGSLILEVGSSGNTLAEALKAIDLFAASVGPALAKLVA